MKSKIINSEAEMLQFGAELARNCSDSVIIYLSGELGAGKTTLVRGFLREFGYQGAVKSPTYTLVESYQLSGKQIYHFDFYRLQEPEELEYMGIRDYFTEPAICLIEWPERAGGFLPPADLSYEIIVKNHARELVELPV